MCNRPCCLRKVSRKLIFSRLSVCLLIFACLSGCAAVYAEKSGYTPPFRPGKKFIVSQAFMGSKTHNNPLNHYAVDLVMPLGEDVCAARSGKVVDLYDVTRFKAGADRRRRANFVRILDVSGRINDYQHLLSGSVNVSMGQTVNKGQCFAKVGNTGISSGPHLLIAVLTASQGLFLKSVPFKFLQPNGTLITPSYLRWIHN